MAVQKHPIRLLIEKFASLLDSTYANRLRKIGLSVGGHLSWMQDNPLSDSKTSFTNRSVIEV